MGENREKPYSASCPGGGGDASATSCRRFSCAQLLWRGRGTIVVREKMIVVASLPSVPGAEGASAGDVLLFTLASWWALHKSSPFLR
jgi:hypothetical protein